jgi:hypothetical protein
MRVEVGIEEEDLLGAALVGRAADERIRGLVVDVLEIEDLIEKLERALVDEARIMERQPIPEVGVGDFDIEGVFFLTDVGRGGEPGLEARGVDSLLDGGQNLKPTVRVFYRFHVIPLIFHRIIHICGKRRSPSLIRGKSGNMIAFAGGQCKGFLVVAGA